MGWSPAALLRSRATVLALIAVATYAPGLAGRYFGDDFLFVTSPELGPADLLLHRVPGTEWYRPLEVSILAAIQRGFGLWPVPVHLVALAIHVALALLVGAAVRGLGFSPVHAAIAALVMLVSQANAMAVLSIDTLSQLLSTALGCASLWVSHRALAPGSAAHPGRTPSPGGHAVWPAALIFLALLAKESATSFLLMQGLLIAVHGRRAGGRRAWALVAWVAIAMLAYTILRALAGADVPQPGTGRYDVALGWNIAANAAFLLGNAMLPVSSVGVVAALVGGPWAPLLVAAPLGLVWVLALLYGVRRPSNVGSVVVLAALALLALLPMALLNHVSELYTYNVMPFVAALAGIAWGELLEAPLRPRLRWAGIALLAGTLACNAQAVWSKARLLHANGERAARLVSDLRPFLERVPPGGVLCLVQPRDPGPEYSVFLMRGFHVLREEPQVVARGIRPDVRVVLAEPDEEDDCGPAAVRVTLRGAMPVPLERPTASAR